MMLDRGEEDLPATQRLTLFTALLQLLLLMYRMLNGVDRRDVHGDDDVMLLCTERLLVVVLKDRWREDDCLTS